MNKKFLVGFFGWGLILTSLVQVQKLIADRDWYFSVYASMGEAVSIRYLFSFAQRAVGIAVGIGLLKRFEKARLLGLALGTFTIATLYWKHWPPAFKLHARALDRQYASMFREMGLPQVSFESLAAASMWTHAALDFLFWFFFIWVMTRPDVRGYFKNTSRCS